MPKPPPRKPHPRRSQRGQLKARLRRENPFQFALLYHDHALAQAMRDRRIEEDAMWRQTDACCIVCHAPLIHATSGIFYCPYERAGMEQRARSMLASQPTRDSDHRKMPYDSMARSCTLGVMRSEDTARSTRDVGLNTDAPAKGAVA